MEVFAVHCLEGAHLLSAGGPYAVGVVPLFQEALRAWAACAVAPAIAISVGVDGRPTYSAPHLGHALGFRVPGLYERFASWPVAALQ